MGRLMRALADDLFRALGREGRFVAVDGVDGSGKTSFTAALVAEFQDRPSIVIHADDFLNPSPVRYAQGRHSPEGFWEDTYNYAALREQVLIPLGRGGDGWYSPASYDAGADHTAPAALVSAPRGALVLVEGMFLHRVELAAAPDGRAGAGDTRGSRTRGSRRPTTEAWPARADTVGTTSETTG
jgi:uridine kinase